MRLLATLLSLSLCAAATAQTCQAVSGPMVPLVVELYTSEGCNSCPPADRWLSSLKGRPNVITAAFHVDYWDRLGWRDRFSSAANTERQARSQAWSGARFSYTPQVQIDGRDQQPWATWQATRGQPAHVSLSLTRRGSGVQLLAQALDGAPQRLELWWALLEDGLVSEVKAGENSGVTLHHDAVVRSYGVEQAWPSAQTRELALPAPTGKQRLLAVVTDAATHRTAQAVELSCPG